ncbi:Dabb family protein [Kitasatospora viridis]|uniref:Stress responsive alpha/beta barrel protein n=1 Tax=Kitasatospora viridis TaxID=281105 RepID=A0A561UI16_9ACTN|nr:Dabb family protein [Kitasatospora viridis]TWF99008.1 stress responsive alpha/beta barrel protein [Kitasatospora viridis]
MIRHLVLFKLHEGIAKDDPRALAAAEGFVGLDKEIPVLLEWQTGWNFSPRDVAYDYAINSLVADEDALKAYATHPAHVAAAQRMLEIATLVVADFEV